MHLSTLILRHVLRGPVTGHSVMVTRPLVPQQMMALAHQDLHVLKHLSHTLPQATNMICFLSQQTAEKSLTAGCLSVFGLDRMMANLLKQHGLLERARRLEATPYFTPTELTSAVSKLEFLYINTRYCVYCHHCHLTTTYQYTYQQSLEAESVAVNIYDKMDKLVAQQASLLGNKN